MLKGYIYENTLYNYYDAHVVEALDDTEYSIIQRQFNFTEHSGASHPYEWIEEQGVAKENITYIVLW